MIRTSPADHRRDRRSRARTLRINAWASALLIFISASLARPTWAAVSTADAVCAPATDPCTITSAVEIADGAVLDFGARAVEVTSTGELLLKAGTATLRCGHFAVRGGGGGTGIDLRGVAGDVTAAGNLTIEARGTCSANAAVACLRTSDCTAASAGTCNGNSGGADIEAGVIGTAVQPGSFTLRSAGPVSVKSSIVLEAGNTTSDAGEITIDSGGNLSVTATIDTSSGAGGGGGAVTLMSDGSIVVTAPLDVRGGAFDAGSLTIDANGDISISEDISANSAGGGGFGGELSVTSGGNITLSGGTSLNRVDITTRGNGPSGGLGGDGGGQGYMAAGNISISEFVRLRADGGAPDGAGGELLFSAGGILSFAGDVESTALGAQGSGGLILISSGGDTQFTSTASTTLTGGTEGGGIAEISAVGNLSLSGVLDVSGSTAGLAGSVMLSSKRAANVSGTVRSAGLDPGGSSNDLLSLDACDVQLSSPALVENTVEHTHNAIIGHDSITIGSGAKMQATLTGANTIRFRAGGPQPVLLGQITPAATLIPDATLTACPECGNTTVEAGETCDDGNTVGGDGCSAVCQNEGCVAQTPGWPGIALCDDGSECTIDSCDAAQSACVHVASCDDGVDCTEDSCGLGNKCVHAPSDAKCHSSNPCTVGLCDATKGCVQLPADGSCDDGLSCTSGDHCSAGECVGSDDCPTGEHCSVQSGTCEAVVTTTTTTATTPPSSTTSTTHASITTTTVQGSPVCGNNMVEAAEQCDDGNTAWHAGDRCTADCTLVGCGDPDNSGTRTASDALFVLRSAVSVQSCSCVCDVDGSGATTAGDALRVLRLAVGAPVTLSCNCG